MAISPSKFDKIAGMVRKKFSRFVTKFNYDFWNDLTTNDIAKAKNPRIEANKWFLEYSKNKNNHYKYEVMRPGLLYVFEYFDPIHKDTLSYFDRRPMSLCIGVVKTASGETREICINFHFLPQKIRLTVIYQIFYMFKSLFKDNLYKDKQQSIPISWKAIAKPLKEFGIGFALRMYDPKRKQNVIEIKQEDWIYAAYYNPHDFKGSTANKLIVEWKNYVKNQRLSLVKDESFS